jgi:AhpD family alkylhydroperoxidase
MDRRLDYQKVLPEGMRVIYALNRYSEQSGLEPKLLKLIKVRASQINGCAYCIDMHTKEARSGGETEQRLYGLNAWHETPYYTERERAALALTEAVTLIADTHVPDEIYQQAQQHFNDEELVKLIIAISMINVWNRLVITFRTPPGSYEPEHFVTTPHEVVTSEIPE